MQMHSLFSPPQPERLLKEDIKLWFLPFVFVLWIPISEEEEGMQKLGFCRKNSCFTNLSSIWQRQIGVKLSQVVTNPTRLVGEDWKVALPHSPKNRTCLLPVIRLKPSAIQNVYPCVYDDDKFCEGESGFLPNLYLHLPL